MRTLLDRLAWRNLSIQAKTGLLFALQLVLVAGMALAALLALTALRNQVAQVSSSAVEIRTLVQTIKLDVEELVNLEGTLLRTYDDPRFDPNTTIIDDDYLSTIDQLRQENIPRLRALVEISATSNELQQIDAELTALSGHLDDSEQRFESLFGIVTELADPATGAFDSMRDRGTELQVANSALNNLPLTRQVALMRGVEGTLTDDPEAGRVALDDLAQAYLELYEEEIPVVARDQAVPDAVNAYLTEVDVVADLVFRLTLATGASDIMSGSLRTSASQLESMAEVQASRQLEVIDTFQGTARIILGVGILIVIAVGGIGTFLFSRDLGTRVTRLVRTTRGFEAGNLAIRAEVIGRDEFSQLSQSFNAMAVQLAELVGGLEQRVAERTRDLTITAEIGQAVITENDPRTLMDEVVELIRRRFGFYHAQVFIVDDEGKRANLVASTGSAGRELLARRHSLEVGSLSVIGQVTASAEPVVALDTDASSIHRRNELLPDTRSEMALPMRIGERVIGALDVQSVAPNAFDEDDVAVFQTMSDQLAIALENARLFAELEDTRSILQTIEQRLTGQAWRAYEKERDPDAPLQYALTAGGIVPLDADTPSAIEAAIHRGTLVTSGNGDDINVAVPIRVRGEIIGAFGFGGDEFTELSEEDRILVETVVDRVGLALENLRLVEQTARRAEYEQLVNEITAKIVGSTDVNHILQTTVQELGRILRAPQTSVQLRHTETQG